MPQGGKMTSTEAAHFLGLRIDYTLMLVRSGRLAGRKINGEWELDAASVEAYRQKQRARAEGNGDAGAEQGERVGANA